MTGPHFSHLIVTKRRKGRPDKACDPQAGAPGHHRRTVGYAEESERAKRSQAGSLRRCSRGGVRSAG